MITVIVGDFYIFGVAPYHFFAGLGLLAAVFPATLVMLHKGEDLRWFGWQLVLSLLGLLGGGRFFGLLVEVLNALYEGRNLTLEDIGRSAFVAYGGILGFLLVYRLVLRWLKKHKGALINEKAQLDVLAVFIPLFHGVARLGCLFTGCCYGKEYSGPLSVCYVRPTGTQCCIPVQLIEAVCLMLIFGSMLTLFCKKMLAGRLVSIYLAAYAACRFFLEFMRGDLVRGVYFGISFSQIVSLLLLFSLLFFYWRQKRRTRPPTGERVVKGL